MQRTVSSETYFIHIKHLNTIIESYHLIRFYYYDNHLFYFLLFLLLVYISMRYQQCDVCLYANIRIFKQITTQRHPPNRGFWMFVSMQIYEFLSKSQLSSNEAANTSDVCLYANIRIFKQITTPTVYRPRLEAMFVSMQIYEFLSKSQLSQ